MKAFLATRSLAAIVCLWLGMLGVGMGVIEHYANRPGPIGPVPAAHEPGIHEPRTRPLARMYVHPRCPCSRASLLELAALMSSPGVVADVEIHVYRPADAPDDWAKGRAWRIAEQIPRARVLIDPEAARAHADGALTSGHLVVRTAAGSLAFSGGITRSRGQHGPSPAHDRVLPLLRADRESDDTLTLGAVTAATNPVFGCLITQARECATGAKR
ncbi:MAG: hypothetical protein KF912_13170 [Phycisphaeraceae bacterium]|nr:hypothetical protein [Phycisphaeraceae bacterium]MBX3368256.1 hypothetical protein [Phycisphaeraceae bacterium]